MPDDEKRSVGRPRVISTPEEMDAKVDAYYKMCVNPDRIILASGEEVTPSPQPITLTGMIIFLGLNSRAAFNEYESYSDEFFNSVKRAKLLIENAYENRLALGQNAAAHIFALKNFGWRDDQKGIPTDEPPPDAEKITTFKVIKPQLQEKEVKSADAD